MMPIEAMRMRGAGSGGGPVVTLVDANYEVGTLSPADSSCSFQLSSTGIASGTAGGPAAYDWLADGEIASDYEAVVTATGTTSGTSGTFNLGTTRTWTVTRTSNLEGTNTAVLDIAIRRVDTPSVILDAATIYINATVVVA